ncbi:MAG: Holliday junction branch migration protein RuvA [Patescibacteria group bacterium]
MISSLRGTIIESGDKHVTIDVNGIGYKVYVTDSTLHTLSKETSVSLWTYLAVRENALDLYGFISQKERGLFELLITISGIGPKSALGIISLIDADTLVRAVRSGSTSHLVKVSGIGKKTAEKIVLELKDKLGGLSDMSEEFSTDMSSDADTISALVALGYDAGEARDALKKISKDLTDTGAKVKAVLKLLS